ncbi:hypothetical protein PAPPERLAPAPP_00800 [Brevundimonas phage vB_BpoS-Papperlapapp]|uniref:Uncharacterized protein n=1 Tax=Brevundimonas phage vB_BpoS-Domovoi TaxID=2948598 RepID=A0A9E7SJY9_9CAUD|nr:hypothetical protein DOMOVOI_05580 [Brevundimonas phage vB_BpoS-Domovoi]USN15822.1 hypothetical protein PAPPERLAPAPP_00800 [Brevundimonas phage vB_BpoS-Papperlapapp]
MSHETYTMLDRLITDRLSFIRERRKAQAQLAPRAEELRREIARLQGEHDALAAVEEGICAEIKQAQQMASTFSAELKRVGEAERGPVLETPLLEVVKALLDKHHRVENATQSKSLPTFDIYKRDDDDGKIASVICHSACIAGVPLFSVAGYRTKNGSPNTPFRTLREAVDCAMAMVRWHPEYDSSFQNHPGLVVVDDETMQAAIASGKSVVITPQGALM